MLDEGWFLSFIVGLGVGLTLYYLQTKSSRHQHQKLIHSPDKMKSMLRDIADGKNYRVIRAANKEILAIASDNTVIDLREPISTDVIPK